MEKEHKPKSLKITEPDPERLTKGLKYTPSELERVAKEMVKKGTMPPLEHVLAAVADVRDKYADQYREAGEGSEADDVESEV